MEVELLKWLQGSPNCRLPCFGGIIPDQTTWAEAKQVLAPLGAIVGLHENFPCSSGPCHWLEWYPGGDYKHNSMKLAGQFQSGEDNRVDRIEIQIEKPPSPILRLDWILSNYGSPAKAFVHGSPSWYRGPSLDLLLAYPNHKFIIHLFWFGSWSNGDTTINACIQQNLISLYIDSTANEWTDNFIKDLVYPPDTIPAEDIIPLEKATGLTMEEFYNTFKVISGDECLNVPFQ